MVWGIPNVKGGLTIHNLREIDRFFVFLKNTSKKIIQLFITSHYEPPADEAGCIIPTRNRVGYRRRHLRRNAQLLTNPCFQAAKA